MTTLLARSKFLPRRLAKGGGVSPSVKPDVRKIVKPPVGGDGLFKQPADVGPERERDEQHNRERFANHFHYADPYAGNTRTFDEKGDYNCGRCNMADGERCLLVSLKVIDPAAGSCGDWENTCAGDAEIPLHLKTIEEAGYGIAQNGKGFGCARCPFASKAFQADSNGRDLYCGKGDFRVFSNACCGLNGAPLVPIDEQGVPKNQAELPTKTLRGPSFDLLTKTLSSLNEVSGGALRGAEQKMPFYPRSWLEEQTRSPDKEGDRQETQEGERDEGNETGEYPAPPVVRKALVKFPKLKGIGRNRVEVTESLLCRTKSAAKD